MQKSFQPSFKKLWKQLGEICELSHKQKLRVSDRKYQKVLESWILWKLIFFSALMVLWTFNKSFYDFISEIPVHLSVEVTSTGWYIPEHSWYKVLRTERDRTTIMLEYYSDSKITGKGKPFILKLIFTIILMRQERFYLPSMNRWE